MESRRNDHNKTWFPYGTKKKEDLLINLELYNRVGMVAVTPSISSSSDIDSATGSKIVFKERELLIQFDHNYPADAELHTTLEKNASQEERLAYEALEKERELSHAANSNSQNKDNDEYHVAMFNPKRRKEVYLPFSYFDGQHNVGLYVHPSLSAENKVPDFIQSDFSIDTVHTVGCLFGAQLKGVDERDGKYPLIKHDIKFYEGQKFVSIEYDSEANNPYEQLHFSELEMLACFMDQFANRSEILLMDKLPSVGQEEKSTSIITPEGLFQLNESGSDYDLILVPDKLKQLFSHLEKNTKVSGIPSVIPALSNLDKQIPLKSVLSNKEFLRLNHDVMANKGHTLMDTTRPKKLIYHLPYYDYMLFGVKLFIRDRIELKALNDLFSEIISKKKSHEDKIRGICSRHNIDVTIESPFDNLFGPLDELLKGDTPIGEAILNELGITPQNNAIDIKEPSKHKEIKLIDRTEGYTSTGEPSLSVLGMTPQSELGITLQHNATDTKESPKHKEMKLIYRCTRLLCENTFNKKQGEVWSDYLDASVYDEITTIEDLIKIANAVEVGVASLGCDPYKTLSFLPLSEHQIQCGYTKYSETFNNLAEIKRKREEEKVKKSEAAILKTKCETEVNFRQMIRSANFPSSPPSPRFIKPPVTLYEREGDPVSTEKKEETTKTANPQAIRQTKNLLDKMRSSFKQKQELSQKVPDPTKDKPLSRSRKNSDPTKRGKYPTIVNITYPHVVLPYDNNIKHAGGLTFYFSRCSQTLSNLIEHAHSFYHNIGLFSKGKTPIELKDVLSQEKQPETRSKQLFVF